MVLASTILVPELQKWFHSFVKESSVNRYAVPMPIDIGDVYLTPDSFISLLFNDEYDTVIYPQYKYLYKQESISCWPTFVLTRLMIYPTCSRYLVIDESEGTNVFNLQQDDLTLLDALLQFRTDSTSVTIIDSAITLLDSTTNILYATYGNLSTYLSKLIFLYLDLEINSNFSNYDNTSLVSNGDPLTTLYEFYLIDKYFEFMTLRESDITTFD